MTNLSLDFGFQGGADAATQTIIKSPSVPVLLNSVGKPTYHPTSARDSEKSSMSKINQPIDEEREALPPNTPIPVVLIMKMTQVKKPKLK